MTVRDIFTIIDIYNDKMNASTAALEFASRRKAHVTGLALALEPIAPGFLASPVPAEYLVEAITNAETSAKEAAAAFTAEAANLGVDAEARNATVYSGGTPAIVRQAQLSDLIVVGQDDSEHGEPMRAAIIETLLFESGVPVLIIPSAWNKPITSEKVMIAWDGSSTAARAVHAALPALRVATSIEVVMVAGSKHWSGEPGADVAAYLARHDHKVTVTTLPRSAPEVSTVLINHAAESGATMLVMGGYGHNRFRQFVLGGVTRDMLEKMTIPTLMTH